MIRKKSLARRRPVILYRVEPQGTALALRAWEADANGRMIKDRKLAEADLPDGAEELHGGCWVTSDDTDGIYDLPKAARQALWQLDDAIRAAYKERAYSWA